LCIIPVISVVIITIITIITIIITTSISACQPPLWQQRSQYITILVSCSPHSSVNANV
jgi:hypothetical protein